MCGELAEAYSPGKCWGEEHVAFFEVSTVFDGFFRGRVTYWRKHESSFCSYESRVFSIEQECLVEQLVDRRLKEFRLSLQRICYLRERVWRCVQNACCGRASCDDGGIMVDMTELAIRKEDCYFW
jgi:hypothetical protein